MAQNRSLQKYYVNKKYPQTLWMQNAFKICG